MKVMEIDLKDKKLADLLRKIPNTQPIVFRYIPKTMIGREANK